MVILRGDFIFREKLLGVVVETSLLPPVLETDFDDVFEEIKKVFVLRLVDVVLDFGVERNGFEVVVLERIDLAHGFVYRLSGVRVGPRGVLGEIELVEKSVFRLDLRTEHVEFFEDGLVLGLLADDGFLEFLRVELLELGMVLEDG